MLGRLIRPFKRIKESLTDKISGFVGPIKNALNDLRGKIPSPKAFAGSEDAADGDENAVAVSQKPGLLGRLKNFKNSLKEMSDMQKLILLTIAICLPAGILISTLLVGFIKKRKKNG
ncbi:MULTISPECIES: hypothetical protein [unclassified Fibrobacter]|uniref:hypothetical protein n=1 Tax=unclassified Fibrobacter TaxID=2634177 RepID=UPI000D6C3D9D|nr:MULTISPECIES: hypothetical protein [unclassified Fibrobacter]PWJ59733.1 hypothetical protein BGX12_1405 [Fibrobacter sp. UWR4]PZW63571.1 hypothetical protein C8E88_10435 [Fibrobacter sp. UWR1]